MAVRCREIAIVATLHGPVAVHVVSACPGMRTAASAADESQEPIKHKAPRRQAQKEPEQRAKEGRKMGRRMALSQLKRFLRGLTPALGPRGFRSKLAQTEANAGAEPTYAGTG